MKTYQGKRIFDFVFSFFLLIILFPLLILISFLILIFDGRPILFYQKRLGYDKEPFIIFKFRTMINGAEDQENKVAEKFNLPVNFFYLLDDPRQTKLGKLLRVTAIDELPQLFNVLKGDMSLVGPRPLPVKMAAKEESQDRFLWEMLPGITGLYQIYDRRKRQRGLRSIVLREKSFLDKLYYKKISWWYDLAIIGATVKVCLASIKLLIKKPAQ